MKLQQISLSSRYADLGAAFGTATAPTPFAQPHLVHVNPAALQLLGISATEAKNPHWAQLGCGGEPFSGSRPFAMKYAGHQFGVYNPELGDGRALLLGEMEKDGEIWELHLKGAGKTPYSRFGDGRAVLRSTIREYLAGEALTGLGIASTRALCLVGSDEAVTREEIETGAMLIRVAKTHIRFGHFEHFFYTRQLQALQTLIEFTCARFLPELAAKPVSHQAEQLLRFTARKSAALVAGWQAVGFAHGVLNTDNMSIIGDSFDFGPYGFLDDYEPGFICNHSDYTGRYAFDKQPGVVLWNLNALAHALSAFVSTEKLRDCLEEFQPLLIDEYAALMRAKLGLQQTREGDQKLCADLLQLLADASADYTLFFRALSRYRGERPAQALQELIPAAQQQALDDWLQHYDLRLQKEARDTQSRNSAMLASNPKYVLRNYLAQKVIEAAERGDYQPLRTLLDLLAAPCAEQPQQESWAAPPPQEAKHLALSCSS